ncbi:CCA tRNA nucleotidyltransferase [Thermosulfurimonas marina]|uniref:CCA tRNA nucleotidyltransferase n=1 Tax=Thermosulfurimonas marina TaxID=2047767 RepID=A0A6H1WQG9_9BACT|nr:HD domain-containing protein [Thermosulfurimonas marina]QJA05441.1 CCA tRNA nucleotidyltransferase [Thermosulfurimonas marina]
MRRAKLLKEWPGPVEKVLAEMARREEIYLTGGAVRDILLRRPVKDLDLTVLSSPPEALGQELARALSWALVPLHEELGVFRVTRGGYTLDLSGLRPGARSLEEDLRRRDFTVNALAVPLREALKSPPESWPLLDPCGGLADLRAGRLRTPARENLLEDPLRILRAYRFFAQGYGEIESETRKWLSEVAPKLSEVAAERVSAELLLILETPQAAETLRLMEADRVFAVLFPELEEGRGIPQPDYHHLDVLGHSLETLGELEKILESPVLPEPIKEALSEEGVLPAVKLAALFHDAGKSRTFAPAGVRAPRITFYEHERASAEMFQTWAERLRLPRNLVKRTLRLIRHHMRPFFLLELAEKDRLTPRAKRRLIRDVPDYPLLFLLALADALSARGPASEPDTAERLAALLEDLRRFEEEVLAPAERERLLTGHDLIALGLKPGPFFREILEAVEEARVEGRVRDREEALAFVQEYVREKMNLGERNG